MTPGIEPLVDYKNDSVKGADKMRQGPQGSIVILQRRMRQISE